MKNKLSFGLLLCLCLVFWQAAKTIEGNLAQEHERHRLCQLDVAALDLFYIVNRVDEIGGDIQLNWKEVTAIAAAKLKNRLHPFHAPTFEAVAKDFLLEDRPNAFEAVAALHLEEHHLELAFFYLEELRDTGYVPERLQPGALEISLIEGLKNPAISNFLETGLLPSIAIAQYILENGWETPIISLEISAFLKESPALPPFGNTYRQQAQKLEETYYAAMVDEDGCPVYAKRLGELIRQYNLQLVDYEVLKTIRHDKEECAHARIKKHYEKLYGGGIYPASPQRGGP